METKTKLSDTMKEILAFMENHGGITQADAFLYLGIGRLSARIFEMRMAGIPIAVEMKQVKKKDGSTAHVAFYRLGVDDGTD